MKQIYLAFCDNCGKPTHMTAHVMRHYFVLPSVDHFYCPNCSTKVYIPAHLKAIAEELLQYADE